MLSIVPLLIIATVHAGTVEEYESNDLSGIYFFQVIKPPSLSYTYEIRLARNFGVDFSKILKEVRLVAAQPIEACEPLTNVVKNAVVFAERGECSFLTKALMAENAGARAIIVSDTRKADDTIVEMIADDSTRKANIPAVYLPGIDGKYFMRHLLHEHSPVIITIPLNLTYTPLGHVKKPPWDLW